MRINEAPCPWCGRKVRKPALCKGTCEYCNKEYHTRIFEYGYNRLTQKQEWRRSVSLVKSLVLWYGTNAIVLYLAVRMIWIGSFFYIINGLMLGTVSLYYVIKRNFSVHLVKAVDGEIQSQEETGIEVPGRRVFLEGDYDTGMYHTAFEIQVLNPDTGRNYERFPVLLNLEEDLNTYIEITQDSPDCLKQPGMYFKLYDSQGEQVYCGVTEDAAGDPPRIYQVQIQFDRQEARLDKKCLYQACMQTEEGDILFYLVLQDRDPLESLKTGREVYEVQLLHHSQKAEKLPVPTKFRLQDKNGKSLGSGELTYFFANRFIISVKTKQRT